MPPLVADVTMRGEESSEEEYDENADEDFNPDQAKADDDQSSSSEDEAQAGRTAKSTRKPRKRASGGVDESLDSGDEATIKEQKRRRRKKATDDGEESGGEGGLIMTRSQRYAAKLEKKERKRATTGDVTIDVDKVWAQLSSMPIGRSIVVPPKPEHDAMDVDADRAHDASDAQPQPDQMITIKRRIEYAGEVTEVSVQVARNSKEAQRYLAEHPEADPDHASRQTNSTGLHRPLRRPSMFEPNPLGAVKGVPMEKLRPRAPSRADVLLAEKRAEEEGRKKAQKMTTVQKSALDWQGFVDQGGFRDELNTYAKSKGRFLEREAFLDNAAGARAQAARDARLKS